MNSRIFALVDCNNFYASCERAFNPALNNKPIVILSNNDGCIIARSNEAKALGVPMGAPYFKHKHLIEKNGVKVFSSNYQLYGDMSQRVMNSLHYFCPDMEIYSIDEAFLRLDKLPLHNAEEYAREIIKKVIKWTGIPISIGLGSTKTLAKLANFIAKKNPQFGGVFDMKDGEGFDAILEKLEVNEIWGVSYGSKERLNAANIFTIADFKRAPAKQIRKLLSVTGEKIFMELHGTSCLGLSKAEPKKQIISSRSFGSKQTEFEPIYEAVANYVARAATKLRSQNSKTRGICVYLRTNFSNPENSYSNSFSIGFEDATCDTRKLCAAAKKCLEKIFRQGFRYHKAGVILFDIRDGEELQENFLREQNDEKSQKLLALMDKINSQNGEVLFFAAQGTTRPWQMKKELRSKCYTTKWDEMLEVK